MKRAALYARFSSELQNERSIDDQFALCRTFCGAQGFAVVSEHGDRAVSGASQHGRAGLAKLLADADAGRCDVVVVEALDRVSRDMGDLSAIWKRLQFAGIPLLAVHDGVADQIQIGVRGLVGALYLTDLANKTRRGLAGKIRAGQRAGGMPYGYRATLGKPGEHRIVEEEADVVRRIFREFARGLSPRTIAHGLNGDGVPPLRGRAWNASTIGGSSKRLSGMLANEVYRGEIVWNRVARVKHPVTAKRVPRINPKSEWHRASAPALRIVDNELWEAVQREIKRRAVGPQVKVRGPRRLLSGLLKCGLCGSTVVSVGNDHGKPTARCSRAIESGDCTNSRKVRLDIIEQAVLEQLKQQLTEPHVIAAAVREFHAEMERLSRERNQSRVTDERRLADLRRKVTRMVQQFADGSLSGREAGRHLSALEAECETLEAKLALEVPPKVVTLHPQALERYIAALDDLAANLKASGAESTKLLRDIVDRVVIHPRDKNTPMHFDIVGKFDVLLSPAVGFVVPPGGVIDTHRIIPAVFTVRC